MNMPRFSLGLTLLGILLLCASCQHTLTGPQVEAEPLSAEEHAAMLRRLDQKEVVAEGANTQIYYKAKAVGDLYLYDDTNGKLMLTIPVGVGDRFLFEPASSRAEINRHIVDMEMLSNPRDTYKLYFIPR